MNTRISPASLAALGLVAVAALGAPRPAAAQIQWKPLGEPGGGGAMTGLGVSPHDPKHLVCLGDMLGVATSFDGGDTWNSTFGFTSYEFSGGVTFHPTDPKVVWVGSATGPYKSVDRGVNWVSKRKGMPPPSDGRYTVIVEKVLIDPDQPKRLLAFGGTSRNWSQADSFGWVWESVDDGETWKHIGTVTTDGFTTEAKKGANIHQVEYEPGSASRLHLRTGAGDWFISDDDGRAWARHEPQGLPAKPSSFTFHPRNAKVLWATLSGHKAGEEWRPGGVYKSVDGGKTFAPSDAGIRKVVTKNDGNQTSRFGNVVVSAANPDVLYTNDGAWNAAALYKSEDGGKNWRPVATRKGIGVDSPFAGEKLAHPETATFAGISMRGVADPASPDRTYWFNTEFILRSVNGGKTWDDATAYRPDPKKPENWRGRGWNGWCSTNFEWDPYRPGVAFAQAMDAGRAWISDDNLKSWRYLDSSKTHPWLGGADVAFSRDGHVYVTTGQFGDNNGVFRSTDRGKNWTMLAGPERGLPEAGWGKKPPYDGVHAHPEDGKKVWVASGGRLLASEDGGEKWTPVAGAPEGVTFLAADPTKPDRFYVSAKAGVFATEDGKAFTNIGGPRPAGRGRLNTDASGRVLLCQWREGRGGVWRYTPATKAWERLLDEPQAFECVADPSDPTRLLLVTNMDPFHDRAGGNGVWISADDGKSWSQENTGLAMLRGQAAAFNPHYPAQVVIGTFGRGFFVGTWPKNYKPAGARKYAAVPEDAAYAKAATAATPVAPAAPSGPAITHTIQDFGPGNFAYAYGETWKIGGTVAPDGAGVKIDATEHGGAGLVLNGANLTPNGEKLLALRLRTLPGNEAGTLNVNVHLGGGKSRGYSIDLSKAKGDAVTLVTVPLGEGDFSKVEQVQFQGANFGAGAKPLKVLIDAFGTTKEGATLADAAAAAAKDPTQSAPPKDKPTAAGWGFYPDYPQAWMSHFRSQVERTKKGNIDVVFLGDSITQGWGDGNGGKAVWESKYAPLKAVNYGIGGDSTRQVLYRLDNGLLDGIAPKVVVLMIGTNNLYDNFNAGSDEEVAAGVKAVVAKLRQKAPGAKVLLLGILPRQNDWFCGRIDKINAEVAKLDDGKTVRYLDLTDKFELSHGKVKPELYTGDQLHLAAKGYEAWAEAMQPLFSQMLGGGASVAAQK